MFCPLPSLGFGELDTNDQWLAAIGVVQCFIFALQLAVFISQYGAFKKQAGFMEATVTEMKEGTRIAQQSANAAQLSAEAAIGVELPTLHVEKIQFLNQIENWGTHFFPTVFITNYGRTPAFVDEIIFNVTTDQVLPEEPHYSSNTEFPEPFVIKAADTYEYLVLGLHRKYSITVDQFKKIHDDDGWLHFYGVIKFKDFLGRKHEKGFAYMYVPRAREFVPHLNMDKYLYQI